MKTQMWIRLRSFNPNDCAATDPYSIKDIPIKNYDELIEWMDKNKGMWELLTVETDYICNIKLTTTNNISVRNVYYVFE